MKEVSWNQFNQIQMHSGTIIEASEFPEARKAAYKIKVDLGPDLGVKNSSAQITKRYQLEELLGKQVLCVTNFPPKQIGPYISEILITGFVSDDDVTLCSPDQKVPNGTRLL